MKKDPSIISTLNESINPLKQDRLNLDLKITLDFDNRLGLDIVVLDRRGFEFRIPSRTVSGRRNMEFVIYENITFKDDVKLTFSENEADPDIVEYRKKILESLHLDSTASRNSRKAIVTSTISYEELKNNKGGVYIKEHDLVIYIPDQHGFFIHPATVTKIVSGQFIDNSKFNEDFRFHVRINDPHNKIGPRFMNIGGEIYEVPITRDLSLMEGALISSSSKCSDYKFANVPMSLEDFDKRLIAFKSKEEAAELGNGAEIEKNKLVKEMKFLERDLAIEDKERQNDLNKSKHDLQVAQNDLKQSEIKHKSDLERLTHILELKEHELELQSLKRKTYYEERSLDRKDSSEIIKWLPLVIGAGIALFFRS